MLVLGLTGGIASGKSTVSVILRKLGAEIIDSDILAHQVTRPGTPALTSIVERFGRHYLNDDGSLNRRRLGRLVFDDVRALADLNAIIHPAVIEAVNARIKEASERPDPPEVLVVDAPLLIEAGMVGLVDVLWVVKLDESTQMKRLIARDGLSQHEARSRIRAQMPLEDKIMMADVVINNSGAVESTEQQVKENLKRHLSEPTKQH